MKRHIYTYIAFCLCFILSSAVFTACSSDDPDIPGYVKEGETATVSLKIDLDEMTERSRADINADLESKVECLWVAIYNARTGERTFSQFYTPNDNFPEDKYGTISDIETKSGLSYIVAVANYKNKTAIDINNKTTDSNLEELLSYADSWDKLRAIVIKQKHADNYASIETPSEAIVMQGSYRKTGHNNDHTEDEGAETVGIYPGTNNLDGKIHLRRVLTQNKFTIKPSDNIISLELISVEVVNAPMLTWLYGRPQDDAAGSLGYANAGDAYNPVMPKDLKHEMYLESQTYTPTSMTVTTDAKGRPNYVFDYWQYENKRTGTASTYAKRETEIKNADGSNSGIYSSLCGNDGNNLLNNNATYIRFKAKIKYIVDNITSPNSIKDDIGKVTYRNAEATYVVHLGYVGDDPTDFNCYRNSKYTYNITVKSVDQILLEAFKMGENQPGAEGSVTDVTDEFFDLDAHFNVFNIYLTKDQLASFTFSMTSYEDDVPHNITNIDDPKHGISPNVPKQGDKNWKYYSWIQLIENGKTDQKETIAKFPDITQSANKNKVLYLNDISKKAEELKTGEGYCFTVYVKEYTYEADYGETYDDGREYGNEQSIEWTHYVNQPSRSATFNVAYRISDDRESQHFKAKYALSQRSIQTYYDITKAVPNTTDNKEGTALGVEHTNEVLGMNIRWTKSLTNDPNNGRYNVWLGLGGSNKGTTAKDKWNDDDILNMGELLNVNEISNTIQMEYAIHLTNGSETRYVPAIRTIANSSLKNNSDGYYNSSASKYDPQTNSSTAQYIQAIYSCMNRNKDENGDNVIQAEELKWYVPASGKYLRMILGRNNLVTPLMAYEQETLPESCGLNGSNTLYHFIASDRKIIWAEEGMSSSKFESTSKWQRAPWQVRCVRNLGTNLKSVSNGEKVKAAYDDTDVDKTTKGGVVKPTRYFGSALRNPTTAPLPPHKTSSSYNRLALYGFEIAPAGNGNTTVYSREAGMYAITYDNTGETPQSVKSIGKDYTSIVAAINSASPCEKLNKKSNGRTGWRIPNQKEIVIMMRMGLISTSGYYNYSLSGNSVSISSESSWGGTPGIMCCTQEHWPGIDETTEKPLSVSVNASDPLSAKNRWCTIEPSSSLATAKNHQSIEGIRCVRDLTVDEKDLTYDQIQKYSTK